MATPTTETQFFTAPDGTEMAIVTRARLDELLAIEEDFEDIEAVAEGRASLREEGGIPLDVDRMIAAGEHPLVAWRKFRGLTQKELADRCDLTQAAISRLEKTEHGAGKPETLAALAAALEAPLWTLQLRGAPPTEDEIVGAEFGEVEERAGELARLWSQIAGTADKPPLDLDVLRKVIEADARSHAWSRRHHFAPGPLIIRTGPHGAHSSD